MNGILEATMSIGKRGENVATAYLESRGYTILDRNWEVRGRQGSLIGEIDIIAERDGNFIFVEVKSSEQKDPAYRPEIRLTDDKLHKVSLAARAWLGKHGKIDTPWQIDAIAVDFTKEPPSVRHYCHVTEA